MNKKKVIIRSLIVVLTICAIIFAIFTLRVAIVAFKFVNQKVNDYSERSKEKEYLKIIDQDALDYYKNKYNIEAAVQNKSEIHRAIYCSSDICSGKPKRAISILLTNGDEIIYDHTSKKFADNRQYDLIISEVNNYYNKILDEMEKEFESSGRKSLIEKDIAIEGREQFSFSAEEIGQLQSKKNLYFHSNFSNAEQFIDDEEIVIYAYSKDIICDKNGSWKDIMNKYTDMLYNKLKTPNLFIEFELHDLDDYIITDNVFYAKRTEVFAKYLITGNGVKIE